MSPGLRAIDARPLVLIALLLGALPATTAAERVTVTVLATTDMHGYLYPYDYFTRQPAARGLAAAATLIAAVRRETPNTLVVDCGDTIQGSPLASVYQAARRAVEPGTPEPMMLAMNRVGYDAMAVGNHEFNFGLEALGAARAAARFPWLSANTVTDGSMPAFASYLLKTVGGVKVAVIGLTTPAVPQWEKPENIPGLSWLAPEEAVGRALAALEAEQPDVTLVAMHSGLGREPGAAEASSFELPGENAARAVAERFPGLAAVVYGHSHARDPGRRVGGVLLVQPKNWAMDVARVDLELEREPGGRFRLLSSTSRLIPVTAETQPDPGILELARPYHEAAERQLDSPVTESRTALSGARGRYEDTALVDAIHEVQLHYTKADVSFAALFQTRVEFPRGPVTRRELAALYLYDNELYAIEGSGRTVREALENASRYFRTCPDPSCEKGPLVDRGVAGFNYETAQGVAYAIDLRQPLGARVVDLSYRGRPLRDDEPLRIAINSYRAGGSAGYSMFKSARIVYRSGREIRDLMADYYGGGRPLPERPDGNWRLLPERAVDTLVKEAIEWR
jgi:2',3'-cyclic-nucleotide 2'-phosphodiesterase/3'-nucleotidase